MCLVYEKVLIARSSSSVLFFRLEHDKLTLQRTWKCYKVLKVRGFIYFIKGNIRIQITTDKKIYIYLVDADTLEPTLENVINNFMSCNRMMFGSKVKYCITFKTNQKSFDIWSRVNQHSFNSNVLQENLDGSVGLPMESMDAFLVGRDNYVKFFNIDTYLELKHCIITIPLIPSTTREPAEIISLQTNKDENVLAVISGKNLCMNEQFANQLFIYRRKRDSDFDCTDLF